MSNVLVRPMTSEDLNVVMAIERRVYHTPWQRVNFEFEIHQNQFAITVVLEYERQIVGHCVAWKLFEEFHIATIAISPDWQGKGWGKYLMQYMMDKAEGSHFAMLEVRETNRRAIAMYEQFGFKAIGMRKRYYKDGENALIMRKVFPGHSI